MISGKKFRLVGLATFSLILILLLHKSSSNVPLTEDNIAEGKVANDAKRQTILTSNNLIDSTNDEKVEEAINDEISKLSNQEEASKTASGSEAKPGKEEGTEEFDAKKTFMEIRSISPVVVFSKTYCPYSKRIKALLKDNYQITPEPTIVELDSHPHGQELQKYLAEVTGRRTVPNVLVGVSNESRGGADDFTKMHSDNTLMDLMNQWGDKTLDVKRVDAPSNS